MAGWRVSIEEKADGYTLVWFDDTPGGSSQFLRTFSSWNDALDEIESVRARYVEDYASPAKIETPERADPEIETPEKPARSTRVKKSA